jgi:hypothetical protein
MAKSADAGSGQDHTPTATSTKETAARGHPAQRESKEMEDTAIAERKQQLKRRFATIDVELEDINKRLRFMEEQVQDTTQSIDEFRDIYPPGIVEEFSSDIQALKLRLRKMPSHPASEQQQVSTTQTSTVEASNSDIDAVVQAAMQRLEEKHAAEREEMQAQIKSMQGDVNILKAQVAARPAIG